MLRLHRRVDTLQREPGELDAAMARALAQIRSRAFIADESATRSNYI
jgi:hypothetical protein